ncbi:nicotinate-nucleotide adenylyltransferase [Agitococcus lubricus]|uniref:Probable nicotinate-nucleotide adenylyltransferase n=1 Tax=Agitococcus lubricus TaxID=1077255 RepID=A0A2T5J1T3_9GAMM|nr:nicotinate-nucleotide adenylyltransferase [Agitococcus lubricus]PTQ90401.1 nicotinate-nucleotide adenylyltransferase [Agitococcus lubricus]
MQPSLLAFMGGSFDPVHQGHIATALALQQQLDGAEFYLMPAFVSPLKAQSTAAHHRLAMLQLAIAAQPSLQIETLELQQNAPSYTIYSLEALRQRYGQQQALAFVMGMDSFLQLPHWYRWQELTDYGHLIVMTRPTYRADFSEDLQQWLNSRRCQQQKMLRYSANGLVFFAQTPLYALSSTAIRQQLATSAAQITGLNSAVLDYIYSHQLYGATHTHES